MLDIYLDIDAKPALPQVQRAAELHSLELYVVTRDYLRADLNLHLILVQDDQVDAGAWILGNIGFGDICVTGDPKLAASCVMRGAQALSPGGTVWRTDVQSAIHREVSVTFAQCLEAAIVAARAAGQVALAPRPPRYSRSATAPFR
jgi:uncharacterized protein YaiI (UPF0178 family)